MVKRIALIGATDNRFKYGNIILKDLLRKGFELFPVNPRHSRIEGLHCYASVAELPEGVELLVFVLPPDKARAVVLESLGLGYRHFWFQPGSADELLGNLLEGREGVSLVMNRCIMVETSNIEHR